MKQWNRRLLALALCLALAAGAFALPALALTTDQARELLEEYYVDEVPRSVLDQDTIQGMLEALGDPYAEYWNAEEYAGYMATMSDADVVGIGVVCSANEEGLLVRRVVEDSPAQAAGLQRDDVIVAVDGVSVKGQELDEAAGRIRGEEGTSVRLTFLRDGRRRTATVVRRAVLVPATTGELLPGGLGYIECTTFGDETGGHFREIMTGLESQANVWVVDLRGNTGGLVTAVGEVGSLFCGPGEMMAGRYRDGRYGVVRGEEQAITDKPVVVLVDGYSASASEALSSALRDYLDAVVIGERTYGKGVAQGIFDQDSYPEYFQDGDALKFTTARFFSPIGNTTDTLGVMPDLWVGGGWALDMVRLLAPTWSKEEAKDPLLFSLEGSWYTVELDGMEEDEARREALAVLLDALPRTTTVVRGGSVSSVAAVEEEFGLATNNRLFPDAGQGTVCDESVLDILYTYGLIGGKDDGLFHPQDELTRAELCQLLAVALNCEVPDNTSPFPDVDEGAWYAPAVTALYNRGLVQGDGEGLFHPEDPVDHQQFFTVMGRLMAWLNCNAFEAMEEVGEEELSLRVLEEYDLWAREAVWLLSCAAEDAHGTTVNLLWDHPEVIDPRAATTRDEAAAGLYRVLYYLDIL